MKYKSFLVVGGAGFVASNLVDHLLKAGASKVVVFDNFFLGKLENLQEALQTNRVIIYNEDARFLTAINNVIAKEQPDVVFNLATKPLTYAFIDPEGAYMTSVDIAHNLVMAQRTGLFKKLIQFSSSEVFGTCVESPMSEGHPLNPMNPYGAGKVAADMLLLSYQKLFNLDISIIRPFNIIGKRQNMGTYAAIVPVTIWRILTGSTPVIEGTGKNTRDLSDVDDVCRAAIDIMNTEEAIGEVINIGCGKDISVEEIITTICKLMDYPVEKIVHGPERPSDVKRLVADISKAKRIIGYSPKTSLEQGIKKTVEWYLQKRNKDIRISMNKSPIPLNQAIA